MKPHPHLILRAVLLAVLLVPLFLASTSWPVKLFVIAWLTGLLGTVSWSTIQETRLERRFIFAFIPIRRQRWSLDKFQRIETTYHSQTPTWSMVALGMWWFVWKAFDWLFPWLGGSYELALRSKAGKRVFVWQGNSESDFEANMNRLIEATGLPVQRK